MKDHSSKFFCKPEHHQHVIICSLAHYNFLKMLLKSVQNFSSYYFPHKQTDKHRQLHYGVNDGRQLFWKGLCRFLVVLSHLELLGVRSRVRLGSSRARLLFLPFLFLLLAFSPQIPSWTPARTRTDHHWTDWLSQPKQQRANVSYHSNDQ